MKKRAGIAQLVEHHVANVTVAGSSPVSRSIKRRHSQVAKAAVCKTVLHRFESGCRLQQNYNFLWTQKNLLFYFFREDYTK